MIQKVITIFILFYSFNAISQTRYLDRVFDSISSKTYTYSIRDKDTLKLDLYQPVNDSILDRPLFVIIHGGGFMNGERNDGSTIYLAENVAKKGFVVASVDYRLVKKKLINCSYPAKDKLKAFSNGAEDLLNAIQYLVKYKNAFLIDGSKIVLFGVSAGGETALNIVYNRELLIKNKELYKNIKPAAVISLSGAVIKPELIIKENAIPTVMYHGVNDKVVPYDTSAHQSCLPTAPGFLLLSGSKIISEKLETFNTSFLLYSYLNKGHDIFNLPMDDFYQAFVFLNKTVFNNKFYQAKITQ
ncbi:carboxylesterase family protein [Mariniflexile fucanivorans]|uniref:Carboxylesterase family protein n=1 Tax=Mariniflexile fucanivorans TaxID=264023 RepID=A0A4R1RPF4_9FLAO|nr:alpha/beta hydrolase fold domain-containing protein [Mariniflexile fucanivorans]TCL67762.1 carboxylesterase family protein [Mariniflexile fucanivorans]